MILDMIVWGFFSALGWMGANKMVDTMFPPAPPAVEQKEVKKEGQ